MVPSAYWGNPRGYPCWRCCWEGVLVTPEQEAAGRWSALAVLATGVLLAMTTWFSASAVIPQLRAAWGLGSDGASLLTISVQLGFVVGALGSAATNLADRVNPRRLILMGALGAAGANAGLLWAHRLTASLPRRPFSATATARVLDRDTYAKPYARCTLRS